MTNPRRFCIERVRQQDEPDTASQNLLFAFLPSFRGLFSRLSGYQLSGNRSPLFLCDRQK